MSAPVHSDVFVWGSELTTELVRGAPCRVYPTRRHGLHELLADAAAFGDRNFLQQDERRVSFSELSDLVTRVADGLVAAGVRPGDRVLLAGRNGIDWVLCLFAVWQAGAVVAAANTSWSADQVRHAIGMVGATVLVHDDRTPVPDQTGITALRLDSLLLAPAGPVADVSGPEVAEDEPAALIFTSGTTGFPRAATLSHRSVIANLHALLHHGSRLPGTAAERTPGVTLISVPLFHIGGLQQVLTTALSGGRLVFQTGRPEPSDTLDLIVRESVTAWAAVPTMVGRVVEAALATDRDPGDFGCLRAITMGGAPVSAELRARVTEAFPGVKRGAGVSYGLTEAGGVVAAGVGAEIQARPGCVGQPIPHVEVSFGDLQPDGTAEILVRSAAMMSGYWGEPSNQSFTADGWLRTGDLGRLDEQGYLFVSGRAKDIVIRGGENISCPRVEAALARHPSVAEVAVVGLPDPDLGEVVAAAVVGRSGFTADPAELAPFLAAELAPFEIPSRWWIRDEALPQNAAGKVVKAGLADVWPAG